MKLSSVRFRWVLVSHAVLSVAGVSRAVLSFAVFALVVLSVACSGDSGSDASSNRERYTSDDLQSALILLADEPDDLSLNQTVWSYYTEAGRYEELVSHAESVFSRSYDVPGKERLAFTSGAFISQAYVLMENFDSASYYLERIIPLMDSEYGSDFLNALTHNIAAMYYFKTELDYSVALEHYEAAYDIMVKIGRPAGQSTLLCNIADIYVYLRDSTGFGYARNAYDINHTDNSVSRPYSRVLSTILLAQMYYLKGDLVNAMTYADEAYSEASAFPQFVSSLDLLYADIAVECADYGKAERYYRKALSGERDSESGVNALIYLRYGTMLSELSRYAEANDVLHKGLGVNSMQYRHELLSALSDVAIKMGDDREALDYYKEYHEWLDSISYMQKERSFQQYRMLLKDSELQSRELDLLRANRRIILIVGISALILIVAISLWVLSRRKNLMYRRMVEAHQQSLTRLQSMRGLDEAANDKDDRDLELWGRMDELMTSERIYRYSDISLDRIAEILGTNRTYVSNVINKYSGMSFYNYIHSYRIEDASRILSDASADVSLKALAGDLGYNSISSFYRAFLKETGVPPSKYREEALKIKQSATN